MAAPVNNTKPFILKWREDAIPGKRPVIKQTSEQKRKKLKEYEANRPKRTIQNDWKNDFPWLKIDSEGIMTCEICTKFFKKTGVRSSNLKNAGTFVTGCKNIRISTVKDHSQSKGHRRAEGKDLVLDNEKQDGKNESSPAASMLKSLQASQRHKLAYLFRNAHAIAKENRPISDYNFLCELDAAKKIETGETYRNVKAAVNFVSSIAEVERRKTNKILEQSKFFSFMMDGSTDVAGDEQETIYIRSANQGQVTERFLNIGNPASTKSQDLFNHIVDVFDMNKIDKGKLIAIGSDGASNMTGCKAGLGALVRQHISNEVVSIHCFCHKLELSFRDVMKKQKLYDKLMTLLIGLNYFYKDSYKNRQGFREAEKATNSRGVFPKRVTGTRWMPHLVRGITAMFKSFQALEYHLATASHTNAKAGGLYKLLTNKHVVAFALFMEDMLKPAMTLSLRLQKPKITLAESLVWVESTIELMEEKKNRMCEALKSMLSEGKLAMVVLKGSTPAMIYTDDIINGFCDAIRHRFDLDSESVTFMKATKILNLDKWPKPESDFLKDFGDEAVKCICQHFSASLIRVNSSFTLEKTLDEWSLLKKLVTKTFTSTKGLPWADVLSEVSDDLKIMPLVIDLLLTVPTTSVSCETSFNQMKLIKTCRRSNLSEDTLDDLMTVKLESSSILTFNPDPAIDIWLAESTGKRQRRLNYKRKSKTIEGEKNDTETVSVATPITVSNSEDNSDTDDNIEDYVNETEPDNFESEIEALCEKNSDDTDDHDCLDFQSDIFNMDRIFFYSRE